MKVDERLLSDFLCDSGMLSRRDLERARITATEGDTSLSHTLVKTGVLNDDDLRRAEAHVLGVPFILLDVYSVPYEVLALLPEAFSRIENVVAYGNSDRGVEVALLSLDQLPRVQAHIGTRRVLPRLTNRASITKALIHYQKYLKETFGSSVSREMSQLQAAYTRGDMTGGSDAAVRAVDALLRHALHQRANEVYIEPNQGGVRVRYRAGGMLYDAMTLPLVSLGALSLRFKTLAQLPLAHGVPVAGRFKISPDASEQVSITVGVTPVVHNGTSAEKLSLVFSRENQSAGLSLTALGLSEKNKQTLHIICVQQKGLVLVCGGTGDGTTTLLYTMLAQLAAPHVRIATIEGAVGMSLPGVSHTQVNTELGLTAAASLRAELKHTPDILMIDCVLDEEVALLAAQAANRGTFVLLRVEATSAAAGIQQLLSLSVPPALLTATFTASVGVRMLPKLCVQSRELYRPSRVEQNELEESVDIKHVLAELKEDGVLDARTAWKDVPLYRGIACAQCDDGYSGMAPLQEIIQNSMTLEDVVQKGATTDYIQRVVRENGDRSFAEDALYKAAQGIVSIEHVLE